MFHLSLIILDLLLGLAGRFGQRCESVISDELGWVLSLSALPGYKGFYSTLLKSLWWCVVLFTQCVYILTFIRVFYVFDRSLFCSTSLYLFATEETVMLFGYILQYYSYRFVILLWSFSLWFILSYSAKSHHQGSGPHFFV